MSSHLSLRYYLLNFAICSVLFLAAAIAMLVIGSSMIAWLRRLKHMKWSAREDTPDTHLRKHGTPSMGGIGIGIAAVVSLLGCQSAVIGYYLATNQGLALRVFGYDFLGRFLSLTLVPIYFLVHLALGLRDDWLKAIGRGGLRARSKFLMQCLLALGLIGYQLLAFRFLQSIAPTAGSHIGLEPEVRYGIFNIVLLVILLVGTCNAVNITDGIDGLAAGLWIQCGLVFVLILRDSWAAAVAGACLGFLAFNRHPARVFMGDTGSLALGAALGATAVVTHTILLLPFIAFIFYIELFSVALQVLYFKYTRKTRGEGVRLFRRAPLHHHFELAGWSEWRVVLTFWGVNLLTSIIGLALWELGYIPRFP